MCHVFLVLRGHLRCSLINLGQINDKFNTNRRMSSCMSSLTCGGTLWTKIHLTVLSRLINSVNLFLIIFTCLLMGVDSHMQRCAGELWSVLITTVWAMKYFFFSSIMFSSPNKSTVFKKQEKEKRPAQSASSRKCLFLL